MILPNSHKSRSEREPQSVLRAEYERCNKRSLAIQYLFYLLELDPYIHESYPTHSQQVTSAKGCNTIQPYIQHSAESNNTDDAELLFYSRAVKAKEMRHEVSTDTIEAHNSTTHIISALDTHRLQTLVQNQIPDISKQSLDSTIGILASVNEAITTHNTTPIHLPTLEQTIVSRNNTKIYKTISATITYDPIEHSLDVRILKNTRSACSTSIDNQVKTVHTYQSIEDLFLSTSNGYMQLLYGQ